MEPDEPDDEDALDDEGTGTPADARENTVLRHLIERLTTSGPPAHRVWLPPLSEPPTLDGLFGGLKHEGERGLVAANWNDGPLTVPVGIIDRPFEQRWDLLTVELDGARGHVGVVGGPQSGKSTLIRALITALALTNTPREVRFYCLDFSGGGLAALGGLPHVGSVATRRDTDLVNRTLVELTELLDRRERLFTSLVKRMAQRQIGLRVSDAAAIWLAENGFDPVYGARPLRRLVQTVIGDQLADAMLQGHVSGGDNVLVDLGEPRSAGPPIVLCLVD